MWRLILISLLALTNISPTFVSFWGYDGEKFGRVKASELSLTPVQVSKGHENNTMRGEVLCVQQEADRVQVGVCDEDSGKATWYSPVDWQVEEVMFSDLNRDGVEELSLLVWRPFKPWPVDRFMPSGGRIASFHDKANMSCHLILIGLADGRIRELWAGSALVDPIRELHAVDLNNDGLQELAALEYAYDDDPFQAALTVWAWNGFGFSLQDRQEGRFSSLLVLPVESGKVHMAH